MKLARKIWAFGQAQQHVQGEGQPAGPAARRQHDHVEHSVVGRGLGEQRQPGLQPADVPDDDSRRAQPLRRPVVGADRGPDRPVPQVPGHRNHVGGVAEALFRRLAGAVQHVRVQPQPGHRDERRAVGQAHVDLVVSAHERDPQRLLPVHRQVQVAGEQVAGAGRDDRHRDRRPGQAGRDRGHGPVAAGGDNHVGPGRRGRFRLALARIVRSRLQPERLGPAALGHRTAEPGAKLSDIIIFCRVGYHGGALRRIGHVRSILAPGTPSLSRVAAVTGPVQEFRPDPGVLAHQDRLRWNARYSGDFRASFLPRPVALAALARPLPAGAVLDLASGPSGIALLAAAAGRDCVAVDASDTGLRLLAAEAARRRAGRADPPRARRPGQVPAGTWPVRARAVHRVLGRGPVPGGRAGGAARRHDRLGGVHGRGQGRRPTLPDSWCLHPAQQASLLPAGFEVLDEQDLADGRGAQGRRRLLARLRR